MTAKEVFRLLVDSSLGRFLVYWIVSALRLATTFKQSLSLPDTPFS